MSVSEFSGCYILRSLNQKYKESCYIGFTVNPQRRIKQHNGEIIGGAFKTHTKRPWQMTLVVYGFPTRKLALRFEWTWQHPTEAAKLKHINWGDIFQANGGPTKYKANLRVMKEMLNSLPWSRLSLKVCVTSQDIMDLVMLPPLIGSQHQVYLGRLDELDISGSVAPPPGINVPERCFICKDNPEDQNDQKKENWVKCPFCDCFLHLRCLANLFILGTPRAGAALIPVSGNCPSCKHTLIWRDIVETRNC